MKRNSVLLIDIGMSKSAYDFPESLPKRNLGTRLWKVASPLLCLTLLTLFF